MALTAKDKGGGYDPIPEDLYLAVCYGIYDIGTQFDERWQKSVHKVVIIWELPACRGDFERDEVTRNLPRAISKRYRLSLHKKADLRKDLEAWRGRKFTEAELKGFDLKNLLGAPCQIQVVHNKVEDRVYANINGIVKAPPGTKAKPENTLQFFSFEEGKETLPKETPEWIMDLMRQSLEWQGGTAGVLDNDHQAPPIEDDDIPF